MRKKYHYQSEVQITRIDISNLTKYPETKRDILTAVNNTFHYANAESLTLQGLNSLTPTQQTDTYQ